MSSSTSGFRNELKVLAVVAIVLGTVELGLRRVETTLSGDLRHMEEIPQIVASLAARGDKPRVLFVGNSLTKEGIQKDLFERELAETAAVEAEVVHPDNSSVLEWYHLVRRHIVQSKNDVDVLVVGFAQTQIQDDLTPQPRRLARGYTGWDDAWDVLDHDLADFDQRAEFLFSKLSVSFAGADRVRRWVLANSIPFYRGANAQRLNRVPLGVANVDASPASIVDPARHERLQDLIELAEQHQIRLILAAIPIVDRYEIKAETQHIIDSAGLALIDGRRVEGIHRESFPDGYHMNEQAAERFTRFVAREFRNHPHWLKPRSRLATRPDTTRSISLADRN